MSSNKTEWTANYTEATKQPPKVGDILRAQNGEDARVDVDYKDGSPPFLYARVFVPCLFGQDVGWFLQPRSEQKKNCPGMKCIFAPKAREEMILRQGLSDTEMRVTALRVIRISKSGQSYIVEVAEHAGANPADGGDRAGTVPFSRPNTPVESECQAKAA